LAVPGAASTLHNYCQAEGLPVSILVNNAGYGDYKPVADADPTVLGDMLQLNVVALTALSCLFAADFKRQGYGRIGNIGSTSAFQPCPGFASYGASKGYVMLFTEALHAELRGSGVTATVINPGFTETGFNARAAMVGHSMTQGAADAKDVAQAVYAAMMAGAMKKAFDLTLQFGNSRVQFGKSIGKFQAIQHQISVMAEHVCAAGMAAEAGFQCGRHTPSLLACAVAKSRTSEAAQVVASIAHAVHGAMGVTAEYELQIFTRRLHEWRMAHGSENHWNRVLGQSLLDSQENLITDFVRHISA
jgi:short-subunit dehydrogenase involved in D-alanine esterification of teichoic acids